MNIDADELARLMALKRRADATDTLKAIVEGIMAVIPIADVLEAGASGHALIAYVKKAIEERASLREEIKRPKEEQGNREQ
jgi:hypothetical protein